MDGALIIDKPAGMTSHDVVARARRIIREKRIGHTGTLDPFATGVLVLLVGRATRLAQFISGAEKEYEATIRLGYSTDTGDKTGAPLARPDSFNPPSDAKIHEAINSFRGDMDQLPPMYSAKKVGGRKLYELARRGEEIERTPVRVTIHEFEPLQTDGQLLKEREAGCFDFDVRVVCSAGTYVRTLAEDLGRTLGVGAHLTVLRRTRAGDFGLNQAVTLEQLEEGVRGSSLTTILLASDAALSQLPFMHLTAGEAERAQHGMRIEVSGANWANEERVRLRDSDGRLLAVGSFDAETGTVHPRVVLADTNASSD